MQLSSMDQGTRKVTLQDPLQHYSHPQHHQHHHRMYVAPHPVNLDLDAWLYQQRQHHHHQQVAVKHAWGCTSWPQSPPSPPGELEPVVRPSLPSISSILSMSAGEHSATSPRGSQSPQQASPSQQQPLTFQQPSPCYHLPLPSPEQVLPVTSSTVVSPPRMTLPPTPPMGPDSVIDGTQSPSASQLPWAQPTPCRLGQPMHNLYPHQLHQQTVVPTYTCPPRAPPSVGVPVGTYYPPDDQSFYHAIPGQYALTSNFAPLPGVVGESGNPPQQYQHHHHHHINASSAPYSQVQDRYICDVCRKAFSRPSSLRIHRNSHTGEKPFGCPYAGCGKAFSVRSNMKRHERSCHSAPKLPVHAAS